MLMGGARMVWAWHHEERSGQLPGQLYAWWVVSGFMGGGMHHGSGREKGFGHRDRKALPLKRSGIGAGRDLELLGVRPDLEKL